MSVLRVATHLWFDKDAVPAAELYTSLFDGATIDRVVQAGEGIPGTAAGADFFVELTIMGQQLILLNGGPQFPFDSQVSLYVLCDDQAEVDRLWGALTADGGAEVACGWLTDRFGLSWQIIPRRFEELMTAPDAAAVARVTAAMLQMKKLDVAALEAAAAG